MRVILFVLCFFTTSLALNPSGGVTPSTRRNVLKNGVVQIAAAGVFASPTKALATTLSTSPSLNPLPSPMPIRNGKALLPKMGVGAWAWGDSLFWGYNKKEDEELEEVRRGASARCRYFRPNASLVTGLSLCDGKGSRFL